MPSVSRRFNPRPPRGGRLRQSLSSRTLMSTVSIHAPRVGGDARSGEPGCGVRWFQSTPPAWGATRRSASMFAAEQRFNPRPPRGGRPDLLSRMQRYLDVSIHAPRVGGDVSLTANMQILFSFNPRPPRGGRPVTGYVFSRGIEFQSTPPAWGATLNLREQFRRRCFNPRPPRGGRHVPLLGHQQPACFNPRPPRGGRRMQRC